MSKKTEVVKPKPKFVKWDRYGWLVFDKKPYNAPLKDQPFAGIDIRPFDKENPEKIDYAQACLHIKRMDFDAVMSGQAYKAEVFIKPAREPKEE